MFSWLFLCLKLSFFTFTEPEGRILKSFFDFCFITTCDFFPPLVWFVKRLLCVVAISEKNCLCAVSIFTYFGKSCFGPLNQLRFWLNTKQTGKFHVNVIFKNSHVRLSLLLSNVAALLFVVCAFDYSGGTGRLRWSNYVQFQLRSPSKPSPWRYLKCAQSQTVNSASSNVHLVLPRAVHFQQIHSLSHTCLICRNQFERGRTPHGRGIRIIVCGLKNICQIIIRL